jgi:hypothetical protein
LKHIHFTYKHIITQRAETAWEQHIINETYDEFLIQQAIFQNENSIQQTFRNLLKCNNKAEQLHHLLGARIEPSISLLNENIYKISDVLGQNYLQFINYRLELIQSDIQDKNLHQIAIYFLSKEYILHEIINNTYLISRTDDSFENKFYETLQFENQPYLSISHIKK